MSTKLTLSAFLSDQGIDSSSSKEAIAEAKKAYWKLYHKTYYQKRKQAVKRFTIRLTKEEYRQLKLQADKHQKSLTEFTKASALAYVDQQYLPRDTEQIAQLRKGITKIGNNINQVVQGLHRSAKWSNFHGGFDERDLKRIQLRYQDLVKTVATLQQQVDTFIKAPTSNLSEAIWELLSEQPGKIPALRLLLDEIEAKQKSK